MQATSSTTPWDSANPNEWLRAISRVREYPEGIDNAGKKKVFRIEEVLCWMETSSFSRKGYEDKGNGEQVFREINKLPDTFDGDTFFIVVVNDDNYGFRCSESSIAHIKELASKIGWLVFATARPFVGKNEGLLWKAIEEGKLWDKTIAVVSATDLRLEGLNIRSNVAIETAAYDLWKCAQRSPILKRLLKCQHVLIRELDSVFHFDKSKTNHFDFYFRPFEQRPEYNPRQYGTMYGYEKILLASLLKEMASKIEQSSDGSLDMDKIIPDIIPDGICSALRLWARHFQIGLGPPQDFPQKYLDDPASHPFDRLYDPGSSPTAVAWVQFPFPWDISSEEYFGKIALKKWSRVDWLRTRLANKFNDANEKFNEFLISVVENGLDDTVEANDFTSNNRIICPFARFGNLRAVGKEEINGFLDISKIMMKYLGDDTWTTPLSLAVFGHPGTGKSFAVKEIFKAVRSATPKIEGEADEPLVYNLAQFTEPQNLTTAFRQVQDAALSGKVPLVFFDEFDARLDKEEYGWLKYFLEPMQDGRFKPADSEGSYRIGKAIFVFSGGAADTFAVFEAKMEQADRSVKGMDFISRLRGHLDIRGISREDETSVSSLLALRRAIILRSILEKKAEQIFDAPGEKARIDKQLITALLWIDRYRHGVRSMEAIVQMARPERG